MNLSETAGISGSATQSGVDCKKCLRHSKKDRAASDSGQEKILPYFLLGIRREESVSKLHGN